MVNNPVVNKIKFGEFRTSEIARKHINECLDKNWVSIGPKVKLFEEKWANLFDYPYTVAVNSGTSADIAACIALYDYGAKPGDNIICPALSFIATANAIRAAGFIPKFVDVEKETLNIDEKLVEDAIDKNTAAIMGVNLMGKPCKMDILSDIAKKHKLLFIIDNCEAYGCRYKDEFSLQYCDMETTSHYIAHIVCSCEGGTVSCKSSEISDAIKSIRSHGRQPNDKYFQHVRYGLNLKQSDLHASIGLGEIETFWNSFNARKKNLYKIREGLIGYEEIAWFIEEDECDVNAPHAFSITLKPVTHKYLPDLKNDLKQAGIDWKRNFGSMPHHKAFEYLNYDKDDFINAQYIGNNGIHIGCHQFLSDDDTNYIIDVLQKSLKKAPV